MGNQMGFYFNADNCIGCHSCEAACSEKNDLPPHIAWRKVGMIEGGSYPDVRRLNLSMACNHCDDPVCLKGCPTNAYIKLEGTGAVIQDSETCFGCRYCIWVCPYNAPAYNPEAGSVSKCNMCADRLAVDLKPACVDACLGHALDFGNMLQMERDRPKVTTTLPGFPDTAITSPNIRFQQEQALPMSMQRVDQERIRYDAQDGHGFQPMANAAAARGPGGLRVSDLRSDEDSLVIFTLLTQMAAGTFTLLIGGLGLSLWGALGGIQEEILGLPGQILLGLCVTFLGVGMGLSTAHLGKPWRCYRALNNLRYSWVSREILFLGGFFSGLVGLEAALVFRWFDPVVLFGMGCMVSLLGWLGILSMAMIYRIPARPYWDHPHTFVAFVTSGTLLGPLVTGVVLGVGISSPAGASIVDPGIRWLAGIVLATLVIQAGTVYRHLQDLKQRGGEGNLSRQMLLQDYETFFSLRSVLGVGLALLMAVLLWGDLHRPAVLLGIMAVGLVLGCLSEVVGRALFYKVVTPMTMPGAFFLKNKRFETYARETGLAEDVSVGVLAERH